MRDSADFRAIADAPAGFRLPADVRITGVTLQVADLDRSLAFYEGLVGLRVHDRGPRRARLGATDAAGTPEVFLELRERAGVRQAPARGRLGLYHVAYVLPDRPSLGRFLRSVVDARAPLGAADHSVSEALYLTDPDGLGVEVYRDRPSTEWVVRDGLLQGGADPIDAGGLLEAAGGAPWAGAPPGTRVGHVHFHVGRLDAASRFYHDGLGFDRVRWAFPGALFLSAGGYHHHVGLNTWAAGAPSAGPEDARLLEWRLEIPEAWLDPAAASLRQAGATVGVDASGSLTASDPWGITVRVAGR